MPRTNPEAFASRHEHLIVERLGAAQTLLGGLSGNHGRTPFTVSVSVSIWEAILLFEARKIAMLQDFGGWLERTRFELEFARDYVGLESRPRDALYHVGLQDPADRFLAATARAYELTLVTADKRLLNVPGLKTLGIL
jgi:PIN domain nuclease of toxin-antitoxin system